MVFSRRYFLLKLMLVRVNFRVHKRQHRHSELCLWVYPQIVASCQGRFEQLGHYFHPTSLLAHLGPVSRQNSTLQMRKEAVEKMNHPNFLCSSTEMEHPWRADWLSARWIYASTNLSGIFRLHAIQFATISADNQKAQVGTKDLLCFSGLCAKQYFWRSRS